MIQKHIIRRLIQSALEEDIGTGDITTTAALTGAEVGRAKAFAKSNIVVAGIDVFREVFLFLDESIQFSCNCEDGRVVKKGGILGRNIRESWQHPDCGESSA